jgi:hypothetical protein
MLCTVVSKAVALLSRLTEPKTILHHCNKLREAITKSAASWISFWATDSGISFNFKIAAGYYLGFIEKPVTA